MTELEMSLTLGMMVEPEKNRVPVDAMIQAEMNYLRHIFVINKLQQIELGRFNTELWAELLPWHSMN
jgi:hypothetical protein